MDSKLDQLRSMTTVVADTGDIEAVLVTCSPWCLRSARESELAHGS